MLHHERLRPPSRDYPADEWNVIEKAFRPDFLAQLEAMLALGNGYMGLRGCPEEGGPSVENGTFINGFYETWPIVYGEDAFGFAKTGQTICNVTDSKIIKLFVDDEPFWLPNAQLLNYDRRLNMKAGTLDRTVTPMGRRMLRDWLLRPLVDPRKIMVRQQIVAELVATPALRATLAASCSCSATALVVVMSA